MPADPARVALAHQVLAQLGVTLVDLQEASDGDGGRAGAVVPTIAEYLPRVIAAAGPGAARTYGSYWTRMATTWGDRRVDSITASDIEPCSGRRSRSPASGGPAAAAATPGNT